MQKGLDTPVSEVEVAMRPRETGGWGGWSREVKLVIGIGGIYVFYLLYGIGLEGVTRVTYGEEKERFGQFTLFLLLVQCVCSALGAYGVLRVRHGHGWKALDVTPPMEYAQNGISYIAAMVFSIFALQFLDYPTQALAKSCRPISVMLVAFIPYFHRKYSLAKYLCVLLITAGLFLFMYMGSSVPDQDPSENYLMGVAIITVALFMDGLTGNLQERIFKKYRPSPQHMMLWCNVWASGLLTLGVWNACALGRLTCNTEDLTSFPGVLVSGEVGPAISFCFRHPSVLYFLGMVGVMSAIGQNFVFFTLAEFGSLMLSIVTTTRKFFTILLSVLLFGNNLVYAQWLGVVIVFTGLALDIIVSRQGL